MYVDIAVLSAQKRPAPACSPPRNSTSLTLMGHLNPPTLHSKPILTGETTIGIISPRIGMNIYKNYFTSSDPHHDMLGGGCQVRVVIENMMGRMENLRTLISGFLGLVILVRWALVTMFLS